MENYVSIIIPVYNRTIFLQRAIKSILNQKYKNFELIIIDDDSNENIQEVVESLNDSRIIFLQNKKNKGVSYSRNKGIKKSKYSLIAFLDSDDEWLPEKLYNQIEYLKLNPNINLVHTEEIWIRNGKKVNQKKRHKKSGGDIFKQSLELCLISPSSVIFRKEIFRKYGLFDESLPVCEDYDLWLRITAFEKVGFISEPSIIKYGGHSDQLSNKYEAMDKYRVISMMKLFKNIKVINEKRIALKKIMLQKINILIKGAVKRKKNNDVKIYKNLINEINLYSI